MRILITGSHGFVGTNLIEAFESRYNIIRWDARENKPLPECDAVIHLAGLVHDTKNTTVAERYYEVNTELTKRIYDKFLESGAKKFLFFSSIKAQDGDTPYAKSKKAAEDYIRKASKNSADKSVYILRPCMIHGRGVKGNLPPLVNIIKKGIPWPLAAFENKRSFASIGNITYIVERVLNEEIPSGNYNICDDEAISTNDLIEIICGCLGKKTRLWRIPQGMMNCLAKIGDVLHLPLNSERLGKLTGDYIVDNSRIKKVLGIDKLPVDAREGVKYTIYCMIG